MSKEPKFYVCKHCGNLVNMIHNSGAKIVCCGEPMTELVANTVEASAEKHIPVININNNIVTVEVGSVAHPMIKEHYIDWVYLLTTQGGQLKNLVIEGQPKVEFALSEGEKVVAAYAYCNLHGLWKAEI